MSKSLDRGKLVELTSEVVSAYVSSNRVAPAELKTIIGSVVGGLAVIGKDHLVCLVCGKKQKTLRRHL